MVDSASGVTRHQRERCFGATLPDDAGLAPGFGDPLGALQVAGVVCPILVKFAPCFRLDCEHDQRCLFDLIIEAAASDPRMSSDSLLPVLVVGR